MIVDKILRKLEYFLGSCIPCRGYRYGNPSDGYEFDCEYEHACDIGCDDCVCNFGMYNPKTGKWIGKLARYIQGKKAEKYFEKLNIER